MATFLQLVQRLRTETKGSGAAVTTVVGQTGEYGRLVNWINDAWLDLQSDRTDWEWMRATATFQTVTGRPLNTLTNIGIAATFGAWARDTFRNYVNPQITLTLGAPGIVNLATHGLAVGDTFIPSTSGALLTGLTAGTTYFVQSVPTTGTFTVSATSGGAAIAFTGTQSGTHTMSSNNTTVFIGLNSEIYMDYRDFEVWRNAYEYGSLRQTQTRPVTMTIGPDKSIGLGPFPVTGYTVLGDYYTVPSYMVANTDTPALPAQFHMAIVWKAMMAYATYEEDGFLLSRAEKEMRKFQRKINADRLQELTTCGAIA